MTGYGAYSFDFGNTTGQQHPTCTQEVCVCVYCAFSHPRGACLQVAISIRRPFYFGILKQSGGSSPPPSRHFLDSFLFYIHVTPYRSAPGPRRRTRNLFTFVDTDSFVSFTLIDGGRVTKASGRDSSSSFRHRLSRTPLFTQSIRDRRSLLRDDRHSARTTRCGIFSS